MSRCSSRTQRAFSTIRLRSRQSARSPRSPSICLSAIRIRSSITARSKFSARLTTRNVWPALLVRWEMLLLQDLGFGLDLSECAATGTDADLIYVSPKSGRAVSRDAGKPYCDRLLKLPRFLLEDDAAPTPADVLAGFALTGHFFERDVLSPHGLALPALAHTAYRAARTPRPHPEEALSRRLEG